MQFPEIPGYRIQRKLGAGGFATVYLAENEGLERLEVLKIMHPNLVIDPSFTERFLREARLVARLSHPNIITVYQVAVEGDLHYIAMEYHPGGDLSKRIAQGIAPRHALEITRQVGLALAHAAESGCIHRDVKPENILFRRDGGVVLTDFGIAKSVDRNTHLTQTGMVIGTPHYMSPEQASDRPLDARSDLYSLGIVLYQMLTRKVPFDADSVVAILYAHVEEPIPRLEPPLARYQPLIDAMLEKDPDKRPQSGVELSHLIDEVLSGASIVGTAPCGADTLINPLTASALRSEATPPTDAQTPRPTDLFAQALAATSARAAEKMKAASQSARATLRRLDAANLGRLLGNWRRTLPWLGAAALASAAAVAFVLGRDGGNAAPPAPAAKPSTAPLQSAASRDQPPSRAPTVAPLGGAQTIAQAPSLTPAASDVASDVAASIPVETADSTRDSTAATPSQGAAPVPEAAAPAPAKVASAKADSADADAEQTRTRPTAVTQGAPAPPAPKRVEAKVPASAAVVTSPAAPKSATPALQPFTVTATPAGATVRIMNIVQRYRPGIGLAPGDYRIEVSASGYETFEGTVAHGPAPTRYAVRLEPLDSATVKTFSDRMSNGSQGPEMVVIPAGSFLMGSLAAGRDSTEQPVHEVSIARPFALSKYELTFAEYDRFAAATGRTRPDDEGWGRGQHPVINVTWIDAWYYVQWLAEETGKPYRLPTEAEWEYAARAGSGTNYSFGDAQDQLCRYGNVADRSALQHDPNLMVAPCDDRYVHTAPSGQFRDNAFGLHDMQGNVWEWVQDCWHKNYRGAPDDGSEWTKILDTCGIARLRNAGPRVFRGGSWAASPWDQRSDNRQGISWSTRRYDLGFRIASDL